MALNPLDSFDKGIRVISDAIAHRPQILPHGYNDVYIVRIA
jgi:hypothetical protein